jgi:hypothetical protein
MIGFIVQVFFLVLDLVLAYDSYKKEEHRLAMFLCFAAGVAFMGSIVSFASYILK